MWGRTAATGARVVYRGMCGKGSDIAEKITQTLKKEFTPTSLFVKDHSGEFVLLRGPFD